MNQYYTICFSLKAGCRNSVSEGLGANDASMHQIHRKCPQVLHNGMRIEREDVVQAGDRIYTNVGPLWSESHLLSQMVPGVLTSFLPI